MISLRSMSYSATIPALSLPIPLAVAIVALQAQPARRASRDLKARQVKQVR